MSNNGRTQYVADRRFRVLSLDGGGIKGTYTASVLASLEKMTGKKIREHFDLITGTSAGGIIAVAMGLAIPVEKILTLYTEHGAKIFPKKSVNAFASADGALKSEPKTSPTTSVAPAISTNFLFFLPSPPLASLPASMPFHTKKPPKKLQKN